MKIKLISAIAMSVSLATLSSNTWAWGKWGHQIVGETGALLASNEPTGSFLRNRAFDMGYYANIPDFIWKRPASYEMERPEHYVDLEIFDRAFKAKPEVKNPLDLSRAEFDKTFPEIKNTDGRAFWRIRELTEYLDGISKQLREMKEPTGKARQDLQERWLVVAGVYSHYFGDLGQPLHVTENHDGQKSGQQGVHSYFEDDAVDQLYPEMKAAVYKKALAMWPKFKKANEKKSTIEIVNELANKSMKRLPTLLALDKKGTREQTRKSSQRFAQLIGDSLVDSSLALAEAYRRQLGWNFDDNRFYFFAGEPVYIKPGPVPLTYNPTPAPPEPPKKK